MFSVGWRKGDFFGGTATGSDTESPLRDSWIGRVGNNYYNSSFVVATNFCARMCRLRIRFPLPPFCFQFIFREHSLWPSLFCCKWNQEKYGKWPNNLPFYFQMTQTKVYPFFF